MGKVKIAGLIEKTTLADLAEDRGKLAKVAADIPALETRLEEFDAAIAVAEKTIEEIENVEFDPLTASPKDHVDRGYKLDDAKTSLNTLTSARAKVATSLSDKERKLRDTKTTISVSKDTCADSAWRAAVRLAPISKVDANKREFDMEIAARAYALFRVARSWSDLNFWTFSGEYFAHGTGDLQDRIKDEFHAAVAA